MSDDKKNESLVNEMLDDSTNSNDALSELDSIENNGLDDFIEEDKGFDDDLGDENTSKLTNSDAQSSQVSEKEAAVDTDIDKLDDEIKDLDNEIKVITNKNENKVSPDASDEGEPEPAKKKAFKPKVSYIAAAIIGVVGVFIIGPKLIPSDNSKPVPVPVAKVDHQAKIEAPVVDQEEEDKLLPEHIKAVIKKSEEKPVKIKEVVVSEPEIKKEEKQNVDVLDAVNKKRLLDTLLKDRARTDAISVKTLTKDGEIVLVEGQDGKVSPLRVGDEVMHYNESLRVNNVLEGGKILLLSNGYFIDEERNSINKDKLAAIKSRILGEQKQAEKDKLAEDKKVQEMILAAAALEKSKYENELKEIKAELVKKSTLSNETSNKDEKLESSSGTLSQAIARIDNIEQSLNDPKEPKLLVGWSVNGNFKERRAGFILNGYLIKNAYGDFFKIIVGDKFQSYGVVKGYDDNGKFFVGNHYIL